MCAEVRFHEPLNSTENGVMSGNPFTAILSNFHVDSAAYVSRNEPGQDPMHKIRPFLDHLLTHFPTSFSPYENLTIDDGVCGFWGRVTFRVYIKNKSDKYGIKMFTVSCSSCFITGEIVPHALWTEGS